MFNNLTVLEGVPDIGTKKALSLLSCPWAYKYKARDRLMISTSVTSPWAGLVDRDGSINLWIRWSSQYSHTSHQWLGHSREETKNNHLLKKARNDKEKWWWTLFIYGTWLILIYFVSTWTQRILIQFWIIIFLYSWPDLAYVYLPWQLPATMINCHVLRRGS